ncbi:MAG: ATP-binding cassette domain-containing protein, partial [Candidatus Deferrimicrobium sp.]
MNVLEAVGVSVSYGDTRVLWDISFSVKKGQLVALLGANGAGKT